MTDDPIVAEVRAERERLVAEFDFDVVRYMEDVRQRETQTTWPIVSLVPNADKSASNGTMKEPAVENTTAATT